jgi:hypothetical protein
MCLAAIGREAIATGRKNRHARDAVFGRIKTMNPQSKNHVLFLPVKNLAQVAIPSSSAR